VAQVIYHPRARQSLLDLYDFVLAKAGPETAGAFVDAIVAYCEGFASFPHRGTRRDDLGTGLRLVGFRRRVGIVFAVDADTVMILGIFYGGRAIDVDAEGGEGTSDDLP